MERYSASILINSVSRHRSCSAHSTEPWLVATFDDDINRAPIRQKKNAFHQDGRPANPVQFFGTSQRSFGFWEIVMFRSILVPIDLAQPSSWEPVLPEAIALARQNEASLAVMTVVRDTSSFFESRYLAFQMENALAEAQRALAMAVNPFVTPDLPIRQAVRFGTIGGEILAEANNCSADLIVMASHRPEMKDYLIGPNAAYVARHAPCSVLVLRKTSAD